MPTPSSTLWLANRGPGARWYFTTQLAGITAFPASPGTALRSGMTWSRGSGQWMPTFWSRIGQRLSWLLGFNSARRPVHSLWPGRQRQRERERGRYWWVHLRSISFRCGSACRRFRSFHAHKHFDVWYERAEAHCGEQRAFRELSRNRGRDRRRAHKNRISDRQHRRSTDLHADRTKCDDRTDGPEGIHAVVHSED